MARADYAHWNEEADYMWWQEEGRHVEEAPDPDDHYGRMDYGYPGDDFCSCCGSEDEDCGCGGDGWNHLR